MMIWNLQSVQVYGIMLFAIKNFHICSSPCGLHTAQFHTDRGHGSSIVPTAAEMEGKAEEEWSVQGKCCHY